MNDNPIRVILDTNVFVAAYWAPGSASARLVRACLSSLLRAQYTEAIKREVMHILRNIKANNQYMSNIDRFWERAELVEPVQVDHVHIDDPYDRKFLEAAMGGQADFLVTNDDHLLLVGYIGRTEILTPSSAVNVMGIACNK